ncbi:MAG: EpsG family protein [Chlorobium sp.]|uniref:EpsG family protein n=1 Tax=Chlorobium sp. TaxID=1095 RepID=UPI002F4009C1
MSYWLYIYIWVMMILFFVKKIGNENLAKSIYWLGVGVVLIIFIGFRKGVGTDYWGYVEYFDLMKYGWLDGFLEPGYVLLMRISLMIFGDSEVGALLLSAIVSYVAILYAIQKYSTDVFLSFLVLFGLGFIFISVNQVRQFIAVTIVILSFSDIWNRRIALFFLKICFAGLIHYSAFIVLPLYLLIFRPVPLVFFWVLGVLAFMINYIDAFQAYIMHPLLIWSTPDVYSGYMYERLVTRSIGVRSGLGVMISGFIGIGILLFLRHRYEGLSDKVRILFNIALIGQFFLLATADLWAVSRIAYYFIIAWVLLAPHLFEELRKAYNGLIIQYIAIMYWVVLYIQRVFFLEDGRAALEYSSYLF